MSSDEYAFTFLDIVLRVCYACDEDFLVVRNRGEMDASGWSGYWCIEWAGRWFITELGE